MRIVFRILATSVFVAGTAIAQSPPGPPAPPAGPPTSTAEPHCVTCRNPSNHEEGCVANYGVECGPNETFDHCTPAQADAWCPGHAENPPEQTPDCAVCFESEAFGTPCYANYGAECNPIEDMDQCTEEQARDRCAGWAEKMALLNQVTCGGS